jgi:hypothetical protein
MIQTRSEYNGQLGSILSEDENNSIFELAFESSVNIIIGDSNMWIGGKLSSGRNF